MSTDKHAAALVTTDDLEIPVSRPVHSGKVRSVYFLTPEDSRRLIAERGYDLAPGSDLAIMVISDRLSAFDCLWRSESMAGVPGKGAALNAIAAHWFERFAAAGIGQHHLLEVPHPMIWVVRQARPLMFEAIARRYITGSLWRAYDGGQREVGGVSLPDGLERYGRLPELLFTPSTKGVMDGLEGVPATDDAPVSPESLRRHYAAFGLASAEQLDTCRNALERGYALVERELADHGQLLVDTKFEFGLAPALGGGQELLYMDEVGTPDSSRIWEREDWEQGAPREHSKEIFREALLGWVPEPRVLLDPQRMDERSALAKSVSVPDEFFLSLGATYRQAAEKILDRSLEVPEDPRESMNEVLRRTLGFKL